MNTLQSQRDVQTIVFGPYDSRRFGSSLGVNPLPQGSRLCNFDCIYCECASGSWPMKWELRPQFPTPAAIHDALLLAADAFGDACDELDTITIAGNGEPTLSPHLDEIVDVVTAARDRDWPQARTVILSNGTLCHKPTVRNALARLDERVIKLDAGTNWILDQMNRPERSASATARSFEKGKLSVTELIRRISNLPDIIIQSMFVHGPVDNTGPAEIEAWTGWIAKLQPAGVQIYSLDRMPAKDWVRQVPRQTLESIAEYVETNTGIPAHIF
jgi:wyosine [tRNA(Phe)-imidazoG37] synthetase (radical SAM superfamily)